jgi:hypothetical protein
MNIKPSVKFMTIVVILHFLLICFFLIGCAHSIDAVDLNRYGNKAIKIITKDSINYELGEGWKIDSLHNISGRGLKIVKNTSNRFHGTIPSECIDKISATDETTPIIIGFIALAISFIITNKY